MKIVIKTIILILIPFMLQAKPDVSKIYGKIKFVDSFPDYRVKVVKSFPDLRVKKTNVFANKPGEWKIVDSFPDFTIQYVDSFPGVK